ncbi:MAG: decaprenyl-phosphate phosphoribosyltransferase [Acidobacteria bacterium]|nr:decaprenyl-phosphate phosphoribosyltransferase [Acidobacteriota bacterium]MBI3655627.1 decaprenyl-phosphate phosphoribosyltransferase [Acidobacteriota bacterium]
MNMKMLSGLLISMRPSQWTKNSFIFAALIFSQKLFHWPLALKSLAAFVLFCFLSGSVYLFNDLFDRAEDCNHPIKRHRPIASGTLSVTAAIVAIVFLTTICLVASYYLDFWFGVVASGYFVLNLLYTTRLKHWVIVDVMIIGIGFVLRAIAGAVVIGVVFSPWLVLCSFLLALFLALCKRRHELVLLSGEAAAHRKILSEYSPYFLDMMITIVTASAIASYAIYTMSEETFRKFQTRNLLYTIVFVIYGIFRYLYLIHQKKEGGNPSRVLLTDLPLQVAIFLWILTATLVIYKSGYAMSHLMH